MLSKFSGILLLLPTQENPDCYFSANFDCFFLRKSRRIVYGTTNVCYFRANSNKRSRLNFVGDDILLAYLPE